MRTINFDNFKEMRLLIAQYFCGNTRKPFIRETLLNMWSQWFKKDFRINGKEAFCVVNNRLIYIKSVKKKDMSVLKKYNQIFQNTYKWIEKSKIE